LGPADLPLDLTPASLVGEERGERSEERGARREERGERSEERGERREGFGVDYVFVRRRGSHFHFRSNGRHTSPGGDGGVSKGILPGFVHHSPLK